VFVRQVQGTRPRLEERMQAAVLVVLDSLVTGPDNVAVMTQCEPADDALFDERLQ
jgi:hypothetical protein